jgi:hypothetical protein
MHVGIKKSHLVLFLLQRSAPVACHSRQQCRPLAVRVTCHTKGTHSEHRLAVSCSDAHTPAAPIVRLGGNEAHLQQAQQQQ